MVYAGWLKSYHRVRFSILAINSGIQQQLQSYDMDPNFINDIDGRQVGLFLGVFLE